jgi:hypothetical protein
MGFDRLGLNTRLGFIQNSAVQWSGHAQRVSKATNADVAELAGHLLFSTFRIRFIELDLDIDTKGGQREEFTQLAKYE